jgi:hypothetical protein
MEHPSAALIAQAVLPKEWGAVHSKPLLYRGKEGDFRGFVA